MVATSNSNVSVTGTRGTFADGEQICAAGGDDLRLSIINVKSAIINELTFAFAGRLPYE